MYRTLLVPLDGSEAAEEALTPALRLAQDDDAELVLLRAVEPQWPAGPAGRALPVTG
ncbi:MAG TPA: universal stress protein, partial [Candidatus Nitrosotenuis sp.]|nr:universal stress protein [Candidatus Nitrosotenuis sp.]